MNINEIIMFILAIAIAAAVIIYSSNSLKEIQRKNKNPLRDKHEKSKDKYKEQNLLRAIIGSAVVILALVINITVKLSNIR